MLPAYTLTVDITTTDITISEEQFVELVASSLAHLDYLSGSFGRSPCTKKYHPPGVLNENSGWAVRAIVMISLGKQRAEFLLQLYQSIAQLIMLELPGLDIKAETKKIQFS